MKTIVVNLWGGPGSGKSTLAAGSFAQLKQLGLNVELVGEYVKAWAWEGRRIRKFDECYIFSKQLHEESILYGKVDYIITDRPLGMSVVYEQFYGGTGLLKIMHNHVRKAQLDENVVNLDLIVKRTKDYDARGRFETKEQAFQIDALVTELFGSMHKVSSIDDVVQFVSTNATKRKNVTE